MKSLVSFFDKKAKKRSKWLRRNKYYNKQIISFMRFHIPKQSSVLEIGCGTGFLLNTLSPKKGMGIDFSEKMIEIARRKYPHLNFLQADAHNYQLKEKYDYIIISDTIGYFEDIQAVLKNIKQNCTEKTRIIITSYNFLWEPFLKLSEVLGLKMKQPFTNWLSPKDITGLLELEDYDIVKTGNKILMPKYIPLISHFANVYLTNLPLFKRMSLMKFIVARPINLVPRKEKSVSIVIAARNEKGHIEKIVQSLPTIGKKTEIIFIEGGSKDDTWGEIKRVAAKYKSLGIKYAQQDGKGKGDAVRKGFDMATGDILMIYDADMTVPAKDLEKFYEAITSNKGEYINGTRLVYPMEKEAMRTLNLFGNKMFSLMFSWLLDQRMKDTLCGTKVMMKENYEILKRNRSYFGDFDPFGDFDLIFGASKMDLKIVEVPIRYQDREYGDTNIQRFSHGWLLIKMCFFAMRKIKFV
jgi:SAM-dependent methyltransferase